MLKLYILYRFTKKKIWSFKNVFNIFSKLENHLKHLIKCRVYEAFVRDYKFRKPPSVLKSIQISVSLTLRQLSCFIIIFLSFFLVLFVVFVDFLILCYHKSS